MSDLSELYKISDYLREKIPSGLEKIKDDIAKAEEDIIKKEILPRLREIVGDALREVRDELVLVVDYKPGQPVSLHLSREAGVVESLTDAKEIVLDEEVTHTTRESREGKITRQNSYDLAVTFPDGTTVSEPKAIDTFQKAIEIIGVERVRKATIDHNIRLSRVPLISNRRDSKYTTSQRDLGDGLYLICHGSNISKKRVLDTLSDKLGLRLTVHATNTKGTETEAEAIVAAATAAPYDETSGGETPAHIVAEDTPPAADESQNAARGGTTLTVKFPDGTVISEPMAKETLKKAIEKIGVERVRQVSQEHGIGFSGIPLVSDKQSTKYKSEHHPIGDGLFLITKSDNIGKRRALNKLSDILGLGLTVTVEKNGK